MKNFITLILVLVSFSAMAQIDRSKAPTPQPNPKINIPTPKISTLDNGLKVIVVENHNLPKISYQLFIDNPEHLEENKVGTADLFGELLGSGTSDYTKAEFDETVDFMGASFFPNSNGFYASSLTKHSEKLLNLLKSVVTSPLLSESEFERIKKQTLSGLEANKSDASSMSSNASAVINYGKSHPYGEVLTEETLNNISLADIRAYYTNFFRPNNAYLVVVGDVTEENAKNLATKYFGDWKALEENIPTKEFQVNQSKGNQVYFVNKPGAVQSVIKITNTIDLKPGSKDAIKLSVLNSILGGGSFSARLMSNLREDKAYTYGCYSSINSDLLVGEFTAGGSFRNEVTDSAVTQILKEITRITQEKVTPAELDLVIKSKTGAFARSLESPQTVARFALNTIRYNLPLNYYADYLKNLEAVTADDLLNVAQAYLRPNNLNIIVVGNEEVAEKLLKFDADGKIDYKNGLGGEAITLEAMPEGVTTKTILDNFIHKTFIADNQKAILKKLKKNKYTKTVYDGTLPQMGMNLELTNLSAQPNKSATLMKANGMTMQQEFFNGTAGKSISMQGEVALSAEDIKEKSQPNYPFDQFHYLNNPNLAITALGVDEVKGVKYYKLEVKNTISEDLKYEWYGVEDGLLHKSESIITNEGESMTITIELSDYKMYGGDKTGMLFSEKQIMNNNGMIIELKLKSVEMGKKVDNELFEGGLK
ncbi:insulinase family protein [Putridiphycobacter roseus]|uniref:Insulinase family protein n=1 Tax=Putridiphycobacter roseus TaxID=2219161 RepID=A0A2W1NUM9_9FLAO|nr:pitrilysin family protein [Putridiphycobacter roseus]PZE18478.1 insulinase family protein [Putridiphycobacter roseus]